MSNPINLFWFRRDLRFEDNTGLFHALKAGLDVLPIFIFDQTILDKLDNKEDKRVDFIHQTIAAMQAVLIEKGKTLWVGFGKPEEVMLQLTKNFSVNAVYTNHDYEPSAIARDENIKNKLAAIGVEMFTFKDQVIFEKEEVTKDDGKPYTIYTPYANKWRAHWEGHVPKTNASEKLLDKLISHTPFPIPSLASMGFKKTDVEIPSKKYNSITVTKYTDQRNFPAIKGSTTHLSVHLRFGTISVRQLALETRSLNSTFFNELIWRDFYHMILWHFPHVAEGKSFRAQYDFIEWRNSENKLHCRF